MNKPVEYFGVTDSGRVRLNNEDSWRAGVPPGFFIVADGLGGHAAGEIASKLAVNWLANFFENMSNDLRSLKEPASRRLVTEILGTVNRRIYETGLAYPEQKGMGTTVVLCLVRDRTALLAHVGDSRAYLLRKNGFSRLTRDHVLFQELLDAGLTSEEERRGNPARFQLTQSLGRAQKITPDISVLDIEPGDILLLCSDGLHDMLDDSVIQIILLNHPVPKDACEALVAAANRAGGADNITVLEVKVRS